MQAYKENKPDLTILDVIMPELDGLSVPKEIITFNPTTKVIMCSAVIGVIKGASAIGAVDFVTKPFRPDNFKEIIITYL